MSPIGKAGVTYRTGVREEDTQNLRAQNQGWDGTSGHLVHPCAMQEPLLILLAKWLPSLHVHTFTDGALATILSLDSFESF